MLELIKINEEIVGYCKSYYQDKKHKTLNFNIYDATLNGSTLTIPFFIIKSLKKIDGKIELFLKY